MMDRNYEINGVYVSSRGVIWYYRLTRRYDDCYSCKRWRKNYNEVGRYKWQKEFWPNETHQITTEFEKLVRKKYGIQVV